MKKDNKIFLDLMLNDSNKINKKFTEELKRHSLNQKKISDISIKSTSPKLKKYNQRAVSDFGAIGDNLPVLNSEDLIIETLQRQRFYKILCEKF